MELYLVDRNNNLNFSSAMTPNAKQASPTVFQKQRRSGRISIALKNKKSAKSMENNGELMQC